MLKTTKNIVLKLQCQRLRAAKDYSRYTIRFKREEIKMQAWEDHHKAKIEAEMRKLKKLCWDPKDKSPGCIA